MNTPENAAQNEWMESMLGEFFDESGQLLDRLNDNLLQLDALVRSASSEGRACCDETLLNEMFRSAHSLKGLSGMLGLADINSLTHRLENVFDAARKEGLPVTGDVVELMFQAVDHLDKLVETLKDPAPEPVRCEAVIERIHRLLSHHGVERKQTSQADAERALAELADQAGAAGLAAAGGESPPAGELKAEGDPLAGIEDDTAGAEKYIPIFIDDAGLSLDRFGESLLAIENGGSRESLKTLLHVAHQVKGSAATVGLNRPAKLAHLMEDLLQNLVDRGAGLSPEAADALLKCTDKLRHYLDSLKHGRRGPDGFGQAAAELLAVQPGAMPPDSEQPRRAGRAEADARAFVPQDSVCGLGTVAPPASRISADRRRCMEAAAPPDSPCLVGQVKFQPGLPMAGLKGQLVYNKLANLGEVCYFDPPPEQLDELDVLENVFFGLSTDKPGNAIREHLKIAGVEELTVETLWSDKAAVPAGCGTTMQVAGPGPATAAGQEEPGRADGAAAPSRTVPDGARTPTETLRVDIEQLDELMNLAGQLVISKARFAQFGDRLKTLRASKRWMQAMSRVLAGLGRLGDEDGGDPRREPGGAELESLRRQARRLHNDLQKLREEMWVMETIPDSINGLSEAVHQLDRVSDAVQQAVMDARMVPIGPLFNRFKRVVRDITRAGGKEIRLVIHGEKTKLDKRMIDELGDPLIHMVRNSADHGIELPGVREAAGKPREGTITLDAFHRGNHVVIQVRDDGAGLDTQRIVRKCLEKGLLNETEAQKMTPHQIHQMIWTPGLSTAEKVTEVSGRGMGMDIVKSKIDLLHGTVDVQSTPGQGTVISIKLPLTLAIQPSLLVEIGGDVFAMPMESVVEIVRAARDKLSAVHGRRTAWVRGRAISIADLDGVFQWARGKQRRESDGGDATIVIVGDAGSELGLEVDAVLGEQDAVIKSITENYRNVAGITGASILGDGRVTLILDIAALISMAASRPAAGAPRSCPETETGSLHPADRET